MVYSVIRLYMRDSLTHSPPFLAFLPLVHHDTNCLLHPGGQRNQGRRHDIGERDQEVEPVYDLLGVVEQKNRLYVHHSVIPFFLMAGTVWF